MGFHQSATWQVVISIHFNGGNYCGGGIATCSQPVLGDIFGGHLEGFDRTRGHIIHLLESTVDILFGKKESNPKNDQFLGDISEVIE